MPSQLPIVGALFAALLLAPSEQNSASRAPSPPPAPAVAVVDAGEHPGDRPGTRWIPPLGTFEVSGPFRAPEHRYGSGHRGIDLVSSQGMAVSAPAAGTVVFAGRVVDRPVITVRVSERTVYSMEPVASALAEGDTVAAGALLGTVASGGHCADECVHFGVRVEGEYVNPVGYFTDRPVLLPWE
ncbi:MAG: peptidoglycan DD-metalloendopeptidase family protein [Leucobacter sp.]